MGLKTKDGSLRVSATMKFPGLANIEKKLTEKLGSKATIRIFSQEGFENIVKKQAYTTGN